MTQHVIIMFTDGIYPIFVRTFHDHSVLQSTFIINIIIIYSAPYFTIYTGIANMGGSPKSVIDEIKQKVKNQEQYLGE